MGDSYSDDNRSILYLVQSKTYGKKIGLEML